MPRPIEDQFRAFLLVISPSVFAATVVELILVEHYEGFVQLIPFILCGVGILTVAMLAWRQTRVVLRAGRVILVLIALGSIYGWYEHIAHNIAFELEIRPTATTGDVFWEALSGASPLLAPGILALGAILAYVATYKHPALRGRARDV